MTPGRDPCLAAVVKGGLGRETPIRPPRGARKGAPERAGGGRAQAVQADTPMRAPCECFFAFGGARAGQWGWMGGEEGRGG